MSDLELVRAWKNVQYRNQLSVSEQALLPEHPAGSIELDDGELTQIQGGTIFGSNEAPCVTNALSPCGIECGPIVIPTSMTTVAIVATLVVI